MIITLCGSARFEEHFHAWNEALTLAGHAVFGLGVYPSQKGEKNWYTPEQKEKLDLAHLAKIQASDAVVFLNVDGYVGVSTRREIEWAKICGKKLYVLESWGEGCSPATQRGEPSYVTSDLSGTSPYYLAGLQGKTDPRWKWSEQGKQEA